MQPAGAEMTFAFLSSLFTVHSSLLHYALAHFDFLWHYPISAKRWGAGRNDLIIAIFSYKFAQNLAERHIYG